MKKFILSILALFPCMAYALPVGSPQDPNLLSCAVFFNDNCCCEPSFCWLGFHARAGFYGDYVFNRKLETNESRFHKVIEKTKMTTNAGYVAFDLCDRLEFFGAFGTTRLFIDTNFIAFSPVGTTPRGQRLFIDTSSDFCWSLGARGIIWQGCCWTLGAEAQYFRTSPDVILVLEESGNAHYPSDLRLRYHEWQVGIGASYNICSMMFPYVAVKWSEARADFHDAFISLTPTSFITLFNLQSERNWGYAIGVSFVLCCNASIIVEGRFVDERALYINGQVRF